MVSLHGQLSLSFRRSAAGTRRAAAKNNANANHHEAVGVVVPKKKKSPAFQPRHPAVAPTRPAAPRSVLRDNPDQLHETALQLAEWIFARRNVLCLTGAGLSTDSGIPDYRGHKGSYHQGHKPMLHQQFIGSVDHRKRYWGRSMVGWKQFDAALPNRGHAALAALEHRGLLGVTMEDKADFYDELNTKDELRLSSTTTGTKKRQRQLSIVTQNVDSLHHRAGSKDVLSLHGQNNIVKCANCGHQIERNAYQQQLEATNQEWLKQYATTTQTEHDTTNSQLRPDGDVQLGNGADYNQVRLPPCPCCNDGFYKPSVVFFGDSVPQHRVKLCQQAVDDCDGILVIGSSLAVHSAYRHVRAVSQSGKSVAILNVGETRAEAEGLDGLTKFEAPIGDTLERCAQLLAE